MEILVYYIIHNIVDLTHISKSLLVFPSLMWCKFELRTNSMHLTYHYNYDIVWMNLWHLVHSYIPEYPAILTMARWVQVSYVNCSLTITTYGSQWQSQLQPFWQCMVFMNPKCIFLLINPTFEEISDSFWLTKRFCLYKQETAYTTMLKNLFARLKGKQEKTSNDVNDYKETQKGKDQTEV